MAKTTEEIISAFHELNMDVDASHEYELGNKLKAGVIFGYRTAEAESQAEIERLTSVGNASYESAKYWREESKALTARAEKAEARVKELEKALTNISELSHPSSGGPWTKDINRYAQQAITKAKE